MENAAGVRWPLEERRVRAQGPIRREHLGVKPLRFGCPESVVNSKTALEISAARGEAEFSPSAFSMEGPRGTFAQRQVASGFA